MLAVIYPYNYRISTARNLIAALIVGCSSVLSKATCAVREVYISSNSSKAVAFSPNTEGSPLYAIGILNSALDTDGAHRDLDPSVEGRGLEAGLGHEFELSQLRALTVMGKALEAGRFSTATIAESLGWPHDHMLP